MDSLKATKMIQNHRGRWPWQLQGSDAEVARGAERIYFTLAVTCFLLAVIFAIIACILRRWGIMLLVAGLFTCASSFAGARREFVHILKLLPNHKT